MTAENMRLQNEIDREPRFERYPAQRQLDHAIEVALERIEEWNYEADPHGWCHERPILITLVAAAIKRKELAERYGAAVEAMRDCMKDLQGNGVIFQPGDPPYDILVEYDQQDEPTTG